MFRAILCSSSGATIVYTQHLDLCKSLFLGDLTACALSGHLRRVTYKEPDAVCIQ